MATSQDVMYQRPESLIVQAAIPRLGKPGVYVGSYGDITKPACATICDAGKPKANDLTHSPTGGEDRGGGVRWNGYGCGWASHSIWQRGRAVRSWSIAVAVSFVRRTSSVLSSVNVFRRSRLVSEIGVPDMSMDSR